MTLTFYHFKISGNIVSIMYQRIKKNSPKKSVNIKKFRSKIRIYLPDIRCDDAMVPAMIKKLTPKI